MCSYKITAKLSPLDLHTIILLQKKALVVRGPSNVRNKELIFMQFSRNETEEDFSAINYMLFAKFSDLTDR